MVIFCLNTGKINQAVECLNELNRVNYNDEKSLEEIAENFYNLKQYEIAANVYRKIVDYNKNRTDIYLKIADIYFNNIEGKKQEAIEFLKSNLKFIDENNEHKKEIEDIYNKYNKEMEMLLTGEENNNSENNENNESKNHNNKMETEEFNIDESQIKKNADFMEDEEEKNENNNDNINNEENNNVDNVNNEEKKDEEKKEEMIMEPEEKDN